MTIGIPSMSEKLITETGGLSLAWYRFFILVQEAVNFSSDTDVQLTMSNESSGAGIGGVTSDLDVNNLFSDSQQELDLLYSLLLQLNTQKQELDLLPQLLIQTSCPKPLIKEGSAQGQISFWNTVASNWVNTEISELFWDDTNKRFGIGTATPTQLLSVNEKGSITAIGGFAVKLTNKTGSNSIAGQIVKADTGTNDAVVLTAVDDTECFGVFLDSGVTDGSEAWIVVSGIVDVAMTDNTAATRGNWVETSSEAGYADATNAVPAAAPEHFQEIGHCIESVAAGGAGTHILARCILHFN